MYKKVPIKQYPQETQKTIWNEFKQPLIVREFASITCIDFEGNDFCFANSTRVQLYSGTTLKKTISRFSDTVFCSSLRQDGKVIVAGDQSGLVQLFDVQSRAILRTFHGHQNAVRAVQFQGLHTVISASDDNSVKIWDISSQECRFTLDEHSDYVRSIRISKDTPHLVLSGSYDHSMKLWDSRNGDCLVTMDHGAPVEDVLFLKGGGLVVSVGSNKLKVWDILKGGSLIHSMSHHSKTITCCVLDPTSSFLLTGGLDHTLKVIEVGTWKVVHIIKYSESILSLGVSDDVLAVGMHGGLLSIRKRIVKTIDLVAPKDIRGGTRDYFNRQGGKADRVLLIK
jgi:U3 small nucleolar RNA-associated protein 15